MRCDRLGRISGQNLLRFGGTRQGSTRCAKGDFGTEDYQRELDAYEQGCMDDAAAFDLAQRRRAEGEARDRYFAAIRTAIYGADLGVEREGQGGDSAEQAPAETVEPTKQPGSADDQDAPPA